MKAVNNTTAAPRVAAPRRLASAAVSKSQSPLDADLLACPDQAEEACRNYLQALRWPDGICCPRCADRSITDIPSRRRLYCRRCRHFFSLTSGRALHNSHLPLWKWFLTLELLLGTDGGVPANELMRVLGGSYKTAWFVEHRIRAAIFAARPPRSSPRRKDPGRERTYSVSITGRYHQLALKYLPVYQAERIWRMRQRHNPNAFPDTVLALLHAEPLSFDELIADQGSRPLAGAKGSVGDLTLSLSLQ